MRRWEGGDRDDIGHATDQGHPSGSRSTRHRSWFRRLPLKARFMLVIAGPISALIVTLHWISQADSLRDIRTAVISQNERLIDVLGRDLERVILLRDSEAGIGIADRLRSLPQVRRLIVHNEAGEPVLAYRRLDLPEQDMEGPRPDGAAFGEEEVVVSKGLENQHGKFAQALLASDASELRARAREARESALWSLALYILLGLVVSHVLQGIVARPIVALSRFVGGVTESGDYSRRMQLDDSSELGALSEGVDGLLATISSHERSLMLALEEARTANQALTEEMTARAKMEVELRQAQKLESVGRLASGVAHEINTPVQFVSDSVHFLRDAVHDLTQVVEKLQEVQRSVMDGNPSRAAAAEAAEAAGAADLPYILENMPKAFERTLDGLDRVATIVRSMKEFAHPDSKEMTAVDMNRAIESTLVVARNEYKYVADVETILGDLPAVVCHSGDVNQAILNIVVNAAHAIGDVMKVTKQMGHITIRTRLDGEYAVIDISDTGGGIPESIRARIFDPFFTTKVVGKGTGQGLAIARSVVVDKHKGELSVESELGRGTTFSIRLPIHGHNAKAKVVLVA